MHLKALIIDDEPLAHDVILRYVDDVDFLEIVGQCYLATEALVFLRKQPVDLIFLDIQMPKLMGLDFLRTLNHKPIVIITSAFKEHALESYELDVCDYLLKPFRFDRFLKAVNKAMETHQFKNQSFMAPPDNDVSQNEQDPEFLFIKSDKRLVQVNIHDIQYLESYGNYVKVWQGKEYLLTPRTLTSFEEQLSNEIFIRVHKSFIVNKNHVDYLEGNMVILKSGVSISVGKNYRDVFKRFF
ncbi:LytTR family DNA-binding domain-containing protein [Fulvivirgaceae bacterium BMA10]|uniref:LytTR family DNA-binding domain-containing protein n=1 Tax=Splendidivirga corallicola TaxID=3051826 RepID=A0ABT8KGG4_9BACT|nr:LytTR family DNA-binding domain-containing protein [Fulvivirgaceae bacterium BMA10]